MATESQIRICPGNRFELEYGNCIGTAGKGTYGTVKIYLKASSSPIAVKFQALRDSSGDFQLETLREITILRRCACPWLVPIQGLVECDYYSEGVSRISTDEPIPPEYLGIIMPAYDCNLYDLIKSPLILSSDDNLQNSRGGLRTIPPGFVIRFARQIAAGLAYMHACGVIHRDLRPSNILYSRTENRVYLADFGISCLSNSASYCKDVLMYSRPPEVLIYECIEKRKQLDLEKVSEIAGKNFKRKRTSLDGTLSGSRDNFQDNFQDNPSSSLEDKSTVIHEIFSSSTSSTPDTSTDSSSMFSSLSSDIPNRKTPSSGKNRGNPIDSESQKAHGDFVSRSEKGIFDSDVQVAYGCEVDIWSFGLLLYHLSYGMPLFSGIFLRGEPIPQLRSIFYYFGTPTSDSWPGIDALFAIAQLTPPIRSPNKSIFVGLSESYPRKTASSWIKLLLSSLTLYPYARPNATSLLHWLDEIATVFDYHDWNNLIEEVDWNLSLNKLREEQVQARSNYHPISPELKILRPKLSFNQATLETADRLWTWSRQHLEIKSDLSKCIHLAACLYICAIQLECCPVELFALLFSVRSAARELGSEPRNITEIGILNASSDLLTAIHYDISPFLPK